MAANKKPRKKYRPKGQWASPMEYVKENLSILSEWDPDYVREIRLKDHSAMVAVQQGTATRKDMDFISATYNVVFALWKILELPDEAKGEMARTLYMANHAFTQACARANEIKRVVCNAEELRAFNDLIALNDNLLDVVTVKQWGDALLWAKNHAYKTKANKEGVPA